MILRLSPGIYGTAVCCLFIAEDYPCHSDHFATMQLVSFTLEGIAGIVCAAVVFSFLSTHLYVPRGLPPGVSGTLALLEIPRQKIWIKLLEISRKYGW